MVAGLYAPGRLCQKNFRIISVMTGNYSDQKPNNGLLSGLEIADYGKTCQLLVHGVLPFSILSFRDLLITLKSS